MKAALIAAMVASIALAGCTTDEPYDWRAEMDEKEAAREAAVAELPEDLVFSELVPAGADPFNNVPGGSWCDPNPTCIYHEFEVPAIEGYDKIIVSGVLTFELPASDFDMELRQDDDVIGSSGNAPGATEQITRNLEPGTYEFVVVPYAVAGDTYTLTVSFDLPPALPNMP